VDRYRGGVLLLALFVIFTVIVKVLSEPKVPGNVFLFHLINDAQVAPLNPVMVFLSEYGREYVWIPVVGLLFFLRRRAAILMASAFVVDIVLGEALKYAVAQMRPFLFVPAHLLIPPPTDFSYPSGHALIVNRCDNVILHPSQMGLDPLNVGGRGGKLLQGLRWRSLAGRHIGRMVAGRSCSPTDLPGGEVELV